MNDEELSGELERRGADLAAWPPDLRREAEALLAGSETARRLWQRAAALDRLLAAAPAGTVPSAASLVAVAVAHAQEPAAVVPRPALPRRRPQMWLRYAACVAAGVAGLLIGALEPHTPTLSDDTFDLALGPPGGLDVN